MWDDLGERWDQVLLSLDNASVHGEEDSEEWVNMDVRPDQRTHLPPYSPDMHSVIELSHSQVMRRMQDYINDRRVPASEDSLPPYIDTLKTIFKETITSAWAQSTTHRLFTKVLPAVLKAEGAYPPKRLR
jgi:hypothetical protein